jgi:hypothetical protein
MSAQYAATVGTLGAYSNAVAEEPLKCDTVLLGKWLSMF